MACGSSSRIVAFALVWIITSLPAAGRDALDAYSDSYLVFFHVEEDGLGRRSQAIRKERARILSALPEETFKIVRTYDSISAVAIRAEKEARDRLLEDRRVLAISRDEFVAKDLIEARALTNTDPLYDEFAIGGCGLTVAVVDTGYDPSHIDLPEAQTELCFCARGAGCCPDGTATQSGPGSVVDGDGHGTHVAGVIVASEDQIQAPRGSAPFATIVAIKVLDDNGEGLESDTLAALDWIASNPDEYVHFVNLSLGSESLYDGDCSSANASTMAYAQVVSTLRRQGIGVFAASGNDASGTSMSAPACVSDVFSVAAVYDADVGAVAFPPCEDLETAPDQVACYSNSNRTTDLFAPGGRMTSTAVGGGVLDLHGTSQATPFVVGCAATVSEYFPTDIARLERALKATTVQVVDPKNGLMFPRLDCRATFQFLTPIFSDGFESGTLDSWDSQ